jgi:hypothetical protein
VVKVKRAYDRIFDGVYSKEDPLNLSQNKPLSKPFNSRQINPSESQANAISNDAAQATSSTALVIRAVNEDEDSDRTPSPHPKKYVSLTNKQISNLEDSPEPDETQPLTPPPENDHSENEPPKTPEPDNQKSPEPVIQINPESDVAQNVVDESPHHVAMDNTFTARSSLNQHFQEIIENLDLEIAQKTPPQHTSHLKDLMHNLSHDCIYIPPQLPSRIMNEPLDQTQEDITNFLKAVDKNIRRMSIAIPNRSIDTAHIDNEVNIMEAKFLEMTKAIKEAYKRNLNVRNELARKEAERIVQERREAEERERKRLEDERIEKERLEAHAREEARLAEEARIAAEQARIENLARNAPEFALLMRQDQENMQRKIDEHSTLLATILSTLQSFGERLPPPPQQP